MGGYDYGYGSVRRFRRDGVPRIPSMRDPAHADLWIWGFNDEIHQPVRFMIMSLLHRSKPAGLSFNAIRQNLRLSQGNLSGHLDRLDRMEYVFRSLEVDARVRYTLIRLTAAGRVAYAEHVRALLDLIAGREDHGG